MTNEQAIITAMLITNGRLIDYKEMLQNTKDIDVHDRLKVTIQAYELIMKALNKQIPKKVNYKIYESNNGGLLTQNKWKFSCPICGDENTIFDFNGDGLNYCGECGQKLDWS